MDKIVHKPWGKEVWLELNDKYCYKRIYINAGYKTSFQYHQFKKETNYIIEGTAEVWLENDEGIIEKKIMNAGDYFNVTPPKKHRVIAITDIILQEVSTPEVDDVFRIDDEFHRADGKILAEHKTPAVLILAAGVGSRLGNLTKNINKAMLPINNKAIISHIIEKFPKYYEFVIALGYKGDILKEYLELTHPEHNFIFVNIENYETGGPGDSTLKCKEYLQRPFYLITADCILKNEVPHLDGNWLGVYPTSYPEKYSTVKVDDGNNVIGFKNKDKKGYDNAFIGVAGIWDYEIFWENLGFSGEVVKAFENFNLYPSFKAKELSWLDTGNLDDLNNAKEYFNDKPLSLYKVTDEITYLENKFIKFNPNNEYIKNKSERAEILKSFIPPNFKSTTNFISYDWYPGNTLYELNSPEIYTKFLKHFEIIINNSEKGYGLRKLYKSFYVDKTTERLNKFGDRFGKDYYNNKFNINGKSYPSMAYFFQNLDISRLFSGNFYNHFHGDLQFDNIIYNEQENKFVYIDWRESFGGETAAGDLYYDLAKLYGGSIINYHLMKNKHYISLNEGSTNIVYKLNALQGYLDDFRKEYENWIIKQGFNLNKIKLITALIFVNMAPLHDEKSAKLLWFKAIELFSDVNK